MINTEDFTQRLQQVMNHYGESASSFAEHIGVQRSSISHIISGRNKPSLEFVLKVLSCYPDVDLYWLLNGKGVFPKGQDTKKTNAQNFLEQKVEPKQLTRPKIEKTISRIVIFYSDGSFENFEN